LLDPFLADLEDLEQMATQPLEQHLQELRERGKGYIRDPETEMGWWHCFQEDRPRNARPDAGPGARVWAPPPREPARAISPPPPPVQTRVRESPKIGRNDPCPCGSGKKYKKCHGAA
jgi:preprotein translocase subunit SecA